jgi:hypothetical protein
MQRGFARRKGRGGEGVGACRSDNNDDNNYHYSRDGALGLQLCHDGTAGESDHFDSRRVWSVYVACICAVVLTRRARAYTRAPRAWLSPADTCDKTVEHSDARNSPVRPTSQLTDHPRRTSRTFDGAIAPVRVCSCSIGRDVSRRQPIARCSCDSEISRCRSVAKAYLQYVKYRP